MVTSTSDEQARPNALLDGGACSSPPDHPVPAELLHRYSVERNPFAEQDVADYVHSQARDETVSHVERVKREKS
jgi:hypothetical protein